MHERSLLGPADVDDTTLASMVAELLGAELADVSLESSAVEEFPYDLDSITTAGRYVVSGEAAVGGDRAPYELFVKVVQSWARSPFFADVPDEMKEFAEASVPWRTEPLAYRSDLAERLPRRARDAARARRLRPRREVRGGLAREGRRRAAAVGRRAARPGGLPPGPALGQPAGGGAGSGRSAPVPRWPTTCSAGSPRRWSRSSTTTGSGSTRWSPRPSPTSCATGCAPRRTSCRRTSRRSCRSPTWPPTVTPVPTTCSPPPTLRASRSSTSASGRSCPPGPT